MNKQTPDPFPPPSPLVRQGAANGLLRAVPMPADYLEQITLRMLGDALATATKAYWERRAAVLDDARPRPGEFHGKATREQLSARWSRLTEAARQCRIHAELMAHADIDTNLLRELLGWGDPPEEEDRAA